MTIRYYEPGTHVWIYTNGTGREKGVVDARQAGVYRVKFESDGHTELRKSADLTLRVVSHG